jgi:hypothetical protein
MSLVLRKHGFIERVLSSFYDFSNRKCLLLPHIPHWICFDIYMPWDQEFLTLHLYRILLPRTDFEQYVQQWPCNAIFDFLMV